MVNQRKKIIIILGFAIFFWPLLSPFLLFAQAGKNNLRDEIKSIRQKKLSGKYSKARPYAINKNLKEDKGVLSRKEPGMPEYAPGEVIVKFKEGVDPQAVLQQVGLEAKGLERIHSIAPAAAKFKKEQKLEKDSDGWYWFLGKQYKEAEKIPEEEAFKEAYKGMPLEERPFYRSYKVILPDVKSVLEAVEELKSIPEVEYAEPNYKAKVFMPPNDPYYASSGSWGQPYDDLWGIKKIQADRAWDISQGEGVVVAVIDTGVDYYHEDLAVNLWINPNEIPGNRLDDDRNGYVDDLHGYDFVYSDKDPMDSNGHGTHAAGIIAAAGNNSIGVIGVAPKAKIMAVKGLDDNGEGYNSNLARCVKYAADNGAKVLNNSWGSPGVSQLLRDIFHYAHSKGCVAVAAAGNDYMDAGLFSPANIDTVITVSASTQDDDSCFFSNYGEKIDVSAPGGGYVSELGNDWFDMFNILSTMPDKSVIARQGPELKVSRSYWRLAGTSMAAPHVSGLAALILAKKENLNPEGVRFALQFSGDDVNGDGKDDYSGYGRINAFEALKLLDKEFAVEIAYPKNGSFVRGLASISGSAFLEEGFKEYKLYFAPLNQPENKTLLQSSTVPLREGTLGVWDTTVVEEGKYILTLEASALRNNRERIIYRRLNVTVDNFNQPPEFVSLVNRGSVIGKLLKFKVRGVDPDDPATPSGRLVYSAKGLPPGATFNPQTQIFSWRPRESEKGIYEAGFSVRDNQHAISRKITLTTVFIEELPYVRGNINDIWEDKAAIFHEGPEYDGIYLYDFSSQSEKQITDGRNYLDQLPRIHKNKVVWHDSFGEDKIGVFVYDLETGEKIRISNDPRDNYSPDIYDNRVVWEEHLTDNYGSGLCLYDMAAKKKTRLFSAVDEFSSAGEPRIYKDKIVCERYRQFQSDIYLYNLTTKKEKQITDNPENQWRPAIYGDKIIWLDKRNRGPHENWLLEDFDIYMYDLAAETESRITPDTFTAVLSFPDISYNKIIWAQQTEWDDLGYILSDICLFDLETKSLTEIFSNLYGGFPTIYKDKISLSLWAEDKKSGMSNLARVFFPPRIISINPEIAKPGAVLTISGSNFGYPHDDSRVEFSNGVTVDIESWTNNRIICKAPLGVKPGSVKVVSPGGESNAVKVKMERPQAPSGLTGKVNSVRAVKLSGGELLLVQYEIQLDWEDNSDNEAGFYIECEAGNKKVIEPVKRNSQSYIHTVIQGGKKTTYKYRIRAYNGAGYSKYSNTHTINLPQR